MARGRQSDQWNHTADLIATMHRVWLGGKWSACEFHPFAMHEVQPAKPQSSFDARIYAIQLCGPKAIEMFRRADLEREKCHRQQSKLGK